MNYINIYKNFVTFFWGITNSFIITKTPLIVKSGIMNNNSTGYWNKTKEKLKQKYPIITEKDLAFSEGKENEMIEILGYKLGKTKIELMYIIAAM